jgi:cyclopropane fatty-acyl-phospholipid synthase-like methyltransferase
MGILLYVLIVLAALTLAYLLGLMNGALYVPTDRKMVEDMLDIANVGVEDIVVDLGSGDGRLVIAAAKRGARAVGYEVNPALVWLSNREIRKAHLEEKARVHWKDFWRADLSPYSVVTVFGIGHIMKRLERKLERELKPGSRVVCNLFTFPTWESVKARGVFLYVR